MPTSKSLVSEESPAMSPKETGNVLFELIGAMQDSERSFSLDNTTDTCDHPDVGNLIEALGYDFLIETLELDERIFSSEYPDLASINVSARQSVKELVNEHVKNCQHCQLEAEHDRAWRDDFTQFLRTEKELVENIFKEKRAAPRGKPRSFIATP